MRESREEEYIRRMRERGYTPTLAGMDDEDIEWELNKMDGMNPFEEARPEEQPLNVKYKPADPAMVARIYRQMGRPYDASLIPERERYYLNGGWDNGDDDKDGTRTPVRKLPDFGPRNGSRIPAMLLPDFSPGQGGVKEPIWSIDPRAKGWRQGWGTEGGSVNKVRPIEYRTGRGWTGFPSSGAEYITMSFESGHDVGTNGPRADGAISNPYAGGYANGGAEGDMLFEVTGVKPMEVGKNANQDPPSDIKLWADEKPDWNNLQPKMKDTTILPEASPKLWHLEGLGVDINLDDYTAEERAKIEEMARKRYKEVLWHKGTGWHLHVGNPIVEGE